MPEEKHGTESSRRSSGGTCSARRKAPGPGARTLGLGAGDVAASLRRLAQRLSARRSHHRRRRTRRAGVDAPGALCGGRVLAQRPSICRRRGASRLPDLARTPRTWALTLELPGGALHGFRPTGPGECLAIRHRVPVTEPRKVLAPRPALCGVARAASSLTGSMIASAFALILLIRAASGLALYLFTRRYGRARGTRAAVQVARRG